MAEYLPPKENLPIFDDLVFQTNNEPLTYSKASKYFLKYPTAQGTETLQTTNVNGVLTANSDVIVKGNLNLTKNYDNQTIIYDDAGFLDVVVGTDYTNGNCRVGSHTAMFAGSAEVIYTTAVGVDSMKNLNISGGQANSCTGIGQTALNNASIISNCTAVGTGSQYSNSIGTDNTSVGAFSLSQGLGIQNTSIGSFASTFSLGNDNTCVGFQAGNNGFNNMTGNRNSVLGSSTVLGTSTSNTTLIGYGATSSTNNQVVLGTTAETVFVPGTLQLNKNNGIDDYVIIKDTYSTNNTFMGVDYSYSNLKIGTQNQLMAHNGVSVANVALGPGAMNGVSGTNGIASDCLAIGPYALNQGTNISNNTAVGSTALYTNNSNDNVAVGSYSMFKNTGNYNTSIGSFSLSNNTVGTNNTCIGYRAGNVSYTSSTTTTGSNNTIIGSHTSLGASTSNTTLIGYNATSSTNNQVVLGSTSETVVIPNKMLMSNTSVITTGNYFNQISFSTNNTTYATSTAILDTNLLLTATVSGLSFTIPTPVGISNRVLRICNEGSNSITLIINTSGSFTGDYGSNTSSLILPDNVNVYLFSDGTNWQVNDRTGNVAYDIVVNTPTIDYSTNYSLCDSIVRFTSASTNFATITIPSPTVSNSHNTNIQFFNLSNYNQSLTLPSSGPNFTGPYGTASTGNPTVSPIVIPPNSWIKMYSNGINWQCNEVSSYGWQNISVSQASTRTILSNQWYRTYMSSVQGSNQVYEIIVPPRQDMVGITSKLKIINAGAAATSSIQIKGGGSVGTSGNTLSMIYAYNTTSTTNGFIGDAINGALGGGHVYTLSVISIGAFGTNTGLTCTGVSGSHALTIAGINSSNGLLGIGCQILISGNYYYMTGSCHNTLTTSFTGPTGTCTGTTGSTTLTINTITSGNYLQAGEIIVISGNTYMVDSGCVVSPSSLGTVTLKTSLLTSPAGTAFTSPMTSNGSQSGNIAIYPALISSVSSTPFTITQLGTGWSLDSGI